MAKHPEKKLKTEKKVVVPSSSSDDSSDEEVVVAPSKKSTIPAPTSSKKQAKISEKAAAKKPVESSSDDDSSSEEVQKPAPKKAAVPAKKAPAKKESSSSDDDSSSEEVQKPAPKKAAVPAKKAPAKKESSSEDSSSEDEKPAPKKPVAPAKKAPAKKESSSEDSSSEDEKPAPKKAAVPAPAAKKAPVKQESSSEEESDNEVVKQDIPIAKKTVVSSTPVVAAKKVEKMEVEAPVAVAAKPQQAAGGDKFSNEVIVKGLSFQADENDIGNFLDEKFGSVARVNLLKGEEGRSKGIAFISFETAEGCDKAVEGSNCEFMGRYLVIEKTKPKEQRPAHLPVDEESKTIFVGNLSFRCDQDTLRQFFASCGTVVDARIAQADGKSRGFGHVEFADKSGVENALKKVGEQLDGRPIKVDVAASRGKREGFNRSTGAPSQRPGGFGGGFGGARGAPRNEFANERKGNIAGFAGSIKSL